MLKNIHLLCSRAFWGKKEESEREHSSWKEAAWMCRGELFFKTYSAACWQYYRKCQNMPKLPKHIMFPQKSKAQAAPESLWARFCQGTKVQMLPQFSWLSLCTWIKGYYSSFFHVGQSTRQQAANCPRLSLPFTWKGWNCKWAGQAM